MVVVEASRLDGVTLQQVLAKVRRAAENARRAQDWTMLANRPEHLPISKEFAAIRALTPPGPQEDSVDIIRALRDE